jgi:hypothetical protein
MDPLHYIGIGFAVFILAVLSYLTIFKVNVFTSAVQPSVPPVVVEKKVDPLDKIVTGSPDKDIAPKDVPIQNV